MTADEADVFARSDSSDSLAGGSASHVLLTGSWSPRFGDNRPDALFWGVGIDHHPVVGVAEIVRSGSTGVHRGVVTRSPGVVENWQPSRTDRVETAGPIIPSPNRSRFPNGIVAVLWPLRWMNRVAMSAGDVEVVDVGVQRLRDPQPIQREQ